VGAALRVTLCVLACACATDQERTAASRRMMTADFEGAAEQLAPCLYSGDEDKRVACQEMLGAIRMRQHRWGAAAAAYRYAFEIRDRVAGERKYGEPSNVSLVNWGFALLRIGERAKARGVLSRVKLGLLYDWKPTANAAFAARVMMAHADGDVVLERQLRSEFDPCDLTSVRHFDPRLRTFIKADYLPSDAWIALGDACDGPDRRSFYEQGLALSVEEKDDDAQKIINARIANNGP
jgi:hypothetical protein